MTVFPIEKFKKLQTPFYYYDMDLLEKTLSLVNEESEKYDFNVHYAIKANANDRILEKIRQKGFGIDCVSGYEIKKALEIGFTPDGIVFAGVGKADWEIELGLKHDIACFNVESLPELEIINELAQNAGKKARVAFRINPNVNANTHHYITTGLDENKFGISMTDLEKVIDRMKELNHVEFEGMHFHIGSQITDLDNFKDLCLRINELQDWFISRHLFPRIINVGGGFGIDYEDPESHPVPDFSSYFKVFKDFLDLKSGQEVHFELGRSVVAQCGNLISRVLYVKEGVKTRFAIIDAGMTDLIRPALYQASHKVQNLTNPGGEKKKYDVVGPICESSDSFGKALDLPEMKRGDFVAIRSAGAYGEVMVSRYNLREEPKAYYSDTI
ncbi:MAG: lysA [Anaerophaga sp.]|uniref:diaminopimelate decarboxylase n=1 Tax=Anaerophaga thermohalophila TaxID=177400 RepID=UPI000237CE43|nr:diaminopimelate decarboxylase [Anaerophaga thermohalophila]MBZ4676839.1 lysA [Anaerophaga sp.]MDI3520913.1 diaminopimelate decarboxylase [Anaerophaga sp.]MDN5290368.1 diaminopimelate decarboxylase [Anaerophaga sp.]